MTTLLADISLAIAWIMRTAMQRNKIIVTKSGRPAIVPSGKGIIVYGMDMDSTR